jgi:hypothetical protein
MVEINIANNNGATDYQLIPCVCELLSSTHLGANVTIDSRTIDLQRLELR